MPGDPHRDHSGCLPGKADQGDVVEGGDDLAADDGIHRQPRLGRELLVVEGGERAGQVGHVNLGQEAELAEVDPEHGGALPVGQPHGAQHRAVPAEADDQVRTLAEFLRRDRDRGAVQPSDLRADTQDLRTLARSPVQDSGHGPGGITLRVQDQADDVHLREDLSGMVHGELATWPQATLTGAAVQEATLTSPASAAAAGTIEIGGDLVVRRMGFGAMRVTGEGIWGDPPDLDQARTTLRRVVELGVNFIDTADSYGPEVSERLIAEALHPYPGDLVIATKGGLVRPGPGRWDADGRPEHLREACEGSLQRLRLDRIPLYQLHRPDPRVPLAESLGMLVQLKDEGKIRHIGISNVSEAQLRAAQQVTPVVSVQNRYNAADRKSESMVDACELEQIAFLPWAPVQQAGSNPAVAEAAKRHDASPRQIVLAWLLARSPQILPIPGTGSPGHGQANVAAASIELSPGEVAAITQGA